MTKKILLSGLAASVLASSAFASNGANLIGSSVESRAMGGVGIATYTGTDAAQNNPAMLAANDGNRLDVADTVLISSANVSSTLGGVDEDYGTTSALLPNIGYVHNINKEMVAAINIAATAGGAIEYDATPNAGQYFSMGVMEATPAFAYKMGELSLGLSVPVAIAMVKAGNDTFDQTYDNSIAVSFALGASYAVNKELTVAAMYKGERMVHAAANYTGAATDGSDDFYAPLPAEYGIGVNYNMGATTLALDVKQILWSTSGSATPTAVDGSDQGFASMGAEDQLVIALGAKHELSKELDLMAGINYGSFALDQVTGVDAGTLGLLPMQATTHITLGANYAINADMDLGAAFTYALPATESASAPSDVEYTASQMAISFGLAMKL